MNNNTFICTECGKIRSAKILSHESLDLTGLTNPVQALHLLDREDRICQPCADRLDPWDTKHVTASPRTEHERWLFSGVLIDRCTADWLALNF